MKNFTAVLVNVVFLACISFGVKAQDCFYYHEYECKYPDNTYFYSGQSRGALFSYGMTSQFKIVTFGGEDYRIAICHQFKVKNVRMRLIEDNESKTVLYDNEEFKYQTEMTFTNNVARKIIVEITVPEDQTGKDKSNMHCLGVLIHFRKTYQEPQNKIGF